MFLQNLVNYIGAHEATLLLASMILIVVLLILVLYQMIRISGMRREVETVAATNARLLEENELIRQFLRRTLVRTASVRFRAFEDMGGDLSYAVAMLDANNDGIIFSSIFARDDSRSYIKPIKGGTSDYALTDEEQGVLKEAMGQALPIKW